jgi:hypothetical protein
VLSQRQSNGKLLCIEALWLAGRLGRLEGGAFEVIVITDSGQT